MMLPQNCGTSQQKGQVIILKVLDSECNFLMILSANADSSADISETCLLALDTWVGSIASEALKDKSKTF